MKLRTDTSYVKSIIKNIATGEMSPIQSPLYDGGDTLKSKNVDVVNKKFKQEWCHFNITEKLQLMSNPFLKKIRLVDLMQPLSERSFQDNLRKVAWSENDNLIVWTVDGLEEVRINRIKSFDDIYRISQTGFYATPYLLPVYIFTSMYLNTKWLTKQINLQRLLKTDYSNDKTVTAKKEDLKSVNENVEFTFESHPTNGRSYADAYFEVLPSYDEVEIFDLTDDYTKEFMKSKIQAISLDDTLYRSLFHRLFSSYSSYVMQNNALKWTPKNKRRYASHLRRGGSI